MRVALFHPWKLPVRGYGGTERVVVWLARGLAELGHRVTLIADRGSRLPGVSVVAVDASTVRRPGFDIAHFIPPGTEILHSFVPPLEHEPPVPWLWTMQGNARAGFDPGPRCVFVSGDHASRHGGRRWVYNGIDPREYEFQSRKEPGTLFLGRLHRVKGWRDAIRISRLAGRRITVAGGWRPSLRPGVRYVGVVDGERKARLLARASALLMPVLWDEPFGIVIAEALMSGTPVIGRPRGSLRELISPEVGTLAESVEELAHGLATGAWDPEACREYALARFTHTMMAERYVELYRELASS